MEGSGGSTEMVLYHHRCPLYAGSCCGPGSQTRAGVTGPEAEQRSWPPSRSHLGISILVRLHLIAVHGGPVQVKLLNTWRPGRRWMGWLTRKVTRSARKLPRACGASSPSPGSAPSSAQATSTSSGNLRGLLVLQCGAVTQNLPVQPALWFPLWPRLGMPCQSWGGEHRCLHALPAPAWQLICQGIAKPLACSLGSISSHIAPVDGSRVWCTSLWPSRMGSSPAVGLPGWLWPVSAPCRSVLPSLASDGLCTPAPGSCWMGLCVTYLMLRVIQWLRFSCGAVSLPVQWLLPSSAVVEHPLGKP